MEFPAPRVMKDMLLLPPGDIILINGATYGSAGWDEARNPAYNPVLYLPDEDPTGGFVVLNPSQIPRMYHSTAALLPDGRVLVGESNPYQTYNFTSEVMVVESLLLTALMSIVCIMEFNQNVKVIVSSYSAQ